MASGFGVVCVDIALDGSIAGIELVDANRQPGAGDDSPFVFTDPTSGREKMLKVA